MERQVTQVKTFKAYRPEFLDEEVNKWLVENTAVEVVGILPFTSTQPIWGASSCDSSYMATIVYKGEVSQ